MTAKLQIPAALMEFSLEKTEFIVESGKNINDIIRDIGINPAIIALVIVNGVQETKEYIVKDDDIIKALAVIGGG
ncbi:hypothetical protein ACFLXB_01955 [Chloroflexota bacterium]